MKRPTVDLGYPTPARGNIPAFQSIEDEADFWDTHDVTDFIENTPAITVSIGSEPGDRIVRRRDRNDQTGVD